MSLEEPQIRMAEKKVISEGKEREVNEDRKAKIIIAGAVLLFFLPLIREIVIEWWRLLRMPIP